MAPNPVDAARRLRGQLTAADEGGYGTHGWYNYLDRRDIDALVEHVLSQTGTIGPSGPKGKKARKK